MTYYYHHVPGRMRVKLPALKNHLVEKAEIETMLLALAGVNSVAINSITGSVIIIYDPEATGPEPIIGLFKTLGLFDENLAVSVDQQMQSAVVQAGMQIGKIVVSWAVGKTLESSGLSLLAAFI
jgi:Heavy metal associated domain 2